VGERIAPEDVSDDVRPAARERLEQSVHVLAAMLDEGRLTRHEDTLGAEVELNLVDPLGRPRPVNDEMLRRLDRWRAAVVRGAGPAADPLLGAVRCAIADDLDAPSALGAVDAWAEAALAGHGDDAAAPRHVSDTVAALLGVDLEAFPTVPSRG
jgi:hypothetical protein